MQRTVMNRRINDLKLDFLYFVSRVIGYKMDYLELKRTTLSEDEARTRIEELLWAFSSDATVSGPYVVDQIINLVKRMK
jgi:hypothetical protein